MRKSITIIGNNVDYAFIIKRIDDNKLTVDKFEVDCRKNVTAAWEDKESNYVEVVLTERISTVTLDATGPTVEKAVEYAGKIIKDIITKRTKKGRKVKISDIKLFEEFIR